MRFALVKVFYTGFYKTFYNCTSLTAIPSGLFDFNTSVSTFGFYQAFYNCTSLTSVPSDLFDNNTLNESFNGTFKDTAITTLSAATWSIVSVSDATEMFNGVTLTTDSYDALLVGWEGQVEQHTVIFDAGDSTYT
ncbi:unnamed protein product, partial [marine sediment metagenome]